MALRADGDTAGDLDVRPEIRFPELFIEDDQKRLVEMVVAAEYRAQEKS